jgi:prepilin-type processing-associated H-X9-DG protein
MHSIFPSSGRRRRRFNIVELVLILTTLIGLASLLLPVLYKGTMQAKALTCSKNLHTIGVWLAMHTSANDNVMPAYEDGWVETLAKTGGKSFIRGKEPKNEFSCPSQPFVSLDAKRDAQEYWRGSSYGINQHISSKLLNPFDEPYGQWALANVKKVKDPTSKVAIADSSGSNYFDLPGRDPTIAGISQFGRTYADGLVPNPARPFPYLRHLNSSGNFLYLDGHVGDRRSWPTFMQGPGTTGFEFWHAEHWYPDSGVEKPTVEGEDAPEKEK